MAAAVEVAKSIAIRAMAMALPICKGTPSEIANGLKTHVLFLLANAELDMPSVSVVRVFGTGGGLK
jgi:hypothetical protein